MKYSILPLALLIPVLIVIAGFIIQKQSTMRAIKEIHQPAYGEIDGLATYEVIPSATIGMTDLDPFLFLNDHGPQSFPANNKGLPFGPHPHRGFETVTFILEGSLMHRDNTGYQSIIGPGGVQWMTAGRGIIHEEISPEEFKREGGDIHILQLWVNLPRELKMTDPKYHGLQKADIPQFSLDNGKTRLNLIAGNWEGTEGPVNSITGLWMSTIELDNGGHFEIPVDTNRQIFMYITNGKLKLNGKEVGPKSLVQFGSSEPNIKFKALENSVVLFGHGEKINEPVAAGGPFVMNSEGEIKKAWEDYEAGLFGRPLSE